jgi:hypothetical protein
MTADASRTDIDTAERRRFLAALGGLAGALGIAAAFVFVPAQAPRLPAAPEVHVMLPQPAALEAPSMRRLTEMARGVEVRRPVPRPRMRETRPAAHSAAAPLPGVAAAPAVVAAARPLRASAVMPSVRTAAVRLETTAQPPAGAVETAPVARTASSDPDADAAGDNRERGPVTGALAAAGSHVGDGFRTVGEGFRTVGRALKRVF